VLKLTQEQKADYFSVSVKTYRKWESGNSVHGTPHRIASALLTLLLRGRP